MTNANDTSPDGREDSDEPTENDRLRLTRRLTVAGAATAAVGSLPTVATANDDGAGLDPDNTLRGPTDDEPRAEWRVDHVDVSVVVDTRHAYASLATADDTTVRVRANPDEQRVAILTGATTDDAHASGETVLDEPQARNLARRLHAAADGEPPSRTLSDHLAVESGHVSLTHAGELSLAFDDPHAEAFVSEGGVTLNTYGERGSHQVELAPDGARELARTLDDAADWAMGRRP